MIDIQNKLIDSSFFKRICNIKDNAIQFNWINRALIIDSGINSEVAELNEDGESKVIQYIRKNRYFDREGNQIDIYDLTAEELKYGIQRGIVRVEEEIENLSLYGVTKGERILNNYSYEDTIRKLEGSKILNSEYTKYDVQSNIFWKGLFKEEENIQHALNFLVERYKVRYNWKSNFEERAKAIKIAIASLIGAEIEDEEINLTLDEKIDVLNTIERIQSSMYGNTNEYSIDSLEKAERIIRIYRAIIVNKGVK